MDNIKKIEYSQHLINEKKSLEKKLKEIEENILENEVDCEHITLTMNAVDSFPCYGRVFRCLLCGQHRSEASPLNVDARYYLLNTYDDKVESQREEKFDVLQTMALGILRGNPQMSGEEFVNYFNNMIQESNLEYTRNLVKKENI